MIGKLHPTSQANSWKSLEKFMFRFPFADAPRLPQFTQCAEVAKSPPNEITTDLNFEHIVLHGRPGDSAITSNLPTFGSRPDLRARRASKGRPWNRQRSSESEGFPYHQRCTWRKNAARREVAGFLFGWANRIKSLSVLSHNRRWNHGSAFEKAYCATRSRGVDGRIGEQQPRANGPCGSRAARGLLFAARGVCPGGELLCG